MGRGKIAENMKAYVYPHTMTRGRFKGQTFNSYDEYLQATRQARARSVTRPLVVGGSSSVRSIIEAYELLIASGIGRTNAIKVLETLSR